MKIKSRLKEELKAIGVDLGRLAFEEFVIDDQKVQDSRSINAQAIANTTAQVSNLEKERTLKIQTEETKLQVMKIQLEQTKQSELTRADIEYSKAEINQKQKKFIAESKAQQEANTLRIKQENAINLCIAKAKMEVEVARLEAEAMTLRGDTDRELQTKLAELYDEYPMLFQLDLARVQAQAMAKVETSVISPEVSQLYFGSLGSRGSFMFNPQ